MSDNLPPLPESASINGVPGYTADQMLAFRAEGVAAAVAAERERWMAGVKVSIPTETMEQEFSAHHRRGFAAGKAAAVPPGWKVVPVEPTMGMCAAGVRALFDASVEEIEATDGEIRAGYVAMLSAAPEVPPC